MMVAVGRRQALLENKLSSRRFHDTRRVKTLTEFYFCFSVGMMPLKKYEHLDLSLFGVSAVEMPARSPKYNKYAYRE